MATDPPNLAEVKIRSEVEAEVRAEYELRDEQERVSQRDRRLLALFITISLAALVVFPMLGLALGLGLRVFRFVAGF